MQSYPPTSTGVELPLYEDNTIYIHTHMYNRVDEVARGFHRLFTTEEKTRGPRPPHVSAQHKMQRCVTADAKGQYGAWDERWIKAQSCSNAVTSSRHLASHKLGRALRMGIACGRFVPSPGETLLPAVPERTELNRLCV